MQIIRSLPELDRKIEECNRAEAISDDRMRAVFETFRMDPPAELPEDPFSQEYREFQLRLYRDIAGKQYANTNEVTSFNVEDMVLRPFPFYTGSGPTTGDYYMAIGFLLRIMALPPRSRVLEFGPGWGNTTIMLAKLGHHVTAVDIEPNFCDLIRRRAAHEQLAIEVINDDFLWAEQAAGQYDAVVFFECFHHCADHLRLLRALDRVVAPGGRIFFGAEPVSPHFTMPWGMRLDGCSLWAIRKNGWMELGFRDDYFIAALARYGWRATKHDCADPGWLTVWEARRRGEPQHFAADGGKLNTQTGTRSGAAFVFDNAPAGTALFGPYVPLPAGRYRARLRFDTNGPLQGLARMDIAASGGERRLDIRDLDLASLRTTGGVAEMEFLSGEELRQVEVRLFNDAGFSGRLLALDIIALD